MNKEWGHFRGAKTNTVLRYDETFTNVVTWGVDAFGRREKSNGSLSRPVEFFKLHLEDVPKNNKPKLPNGITIEKAITDYLHQMGNRYVFLFIFCFYPLQ